MEQCKHIKREIHEGSGSSGRIILADTCDGLDKLMETYAKQVKLIYLDPPYQTGLKFSVRVRVGASDWKHGRNSLTLESFADNMDRSAYLDMMRNVLMRCHKLLRDDGMIFLHVDYRTHPYLRLMLDEIFGEENFLNEIIWAYQTGGRSLRHFSRKHDVILFYRKSARYDFNVQEVMCTPAQPRNNHMRRHVDPDGRVYRSIRSNGRVYTYYDDEPVAPSDVWNDLSHLQQRDPERTGYETQKPVALLERIVKCGSRKGEIVLDPFVGSCTTVDAAARLGRDFIGIDRCPQSLNIARRRLGAASYTLEYTAFSGNPRCEASASAGVGFYHVALERFEMETEACERSFDALDAVDSWSVGYIREDAYYAMAESVRTKREPELREMLNAPVYDGELAICVSDVIGRSFFYTVDII